MLLGSRRNKNKDTQKVAKTKRVFNLYALYIFSLTCFILRRWRVKKRRRKKVLLERGRR